MLLPEVPGDDFTPFLQWALPGLHMQWKGFRKVQNQVVKRIRKRLKELELSNLEEYKDYLRNHQFEWDVLDQLCQITISRFYRDRGIQDRIRSDVLPGVAGMAGSENRILRIWSVGSASGEEPYTISLMMHFDILPQNPGLVYSIEGTEINTEMIRRAKRGCYGKGSVRELPEQWLTSAFAQSGNSYCILDRFKSNVFFHQGDIRKHSFSSDFDMVLCRYLIATYFEEELQKSQFGKIVNHIRPGGYLILGSNEKLPFEMKRMHLLSKGIYRKFN